LPSSVALLTVIQISGVARPCEVIR
jgi:hypothetical protein